MLLRSITLVLVLAGQTSLPAQDESAIDEWIQKQFEAVTIYREGNIPRALTLLNTMALQEQEQTVRRILGQMERIAAGWPRRKKDVPWTPRLLRALGALQMEAAIVARGSRDPHALPTSQAHIDLAKALFAVVVLVTKEDDRAAARWLLAMGLEQMSEAKFGLAYGILIPGCADYENYAPLLVACGSVHETYGSFPADNGLPLEDNDPRQLTRGPAAFDLALSRLIRGLSRARSARKDQLGSARKYLERAMALDGEGNEAPLRLANVRMRQGEDHEAAGILERLLARPSLDERESYLTRLFLSRVRDRQNRLEDATAVLTKMPAAQSALIARAHNAARRGNAREASMLAEQAAQSPLDDPWWGYRFGQYWIPRDLYKELREEARK